MDYENAYKDALERAKCIHSFSDNPTEIKAMEQIFPELAESEDERIRQKFIKLVKMSSEVGGFALHKWEADEMLAWLERQGEKKSADIKIHQGDKNNPYDMSFEEAQNYITKRDFDICCTDYPVYADDRYIIQTIANVLRWADDNPKQLDNKIEPKFKVGDWVVRGKTIAQILDIQEQYYVGLDIDGNDFTSSRFLSDDKIHLWTIADAKDGDVLTYVTAEKDLWIMIYRSLYEPYEGHIHYHALLVNDNFFDKGTCCVYMGDLKPATKEQRKLLFTKMKESGYEWDPENKELRKIKKQGDNPADVGLAELGKVWEENKPKWTEGDDGMLDATECWLDTLCEYLEDSSSECISNVASCINWIKSLKQRLKEQQ